MRALIPVLVLGASLVPVAPASAAQVGTCWNLSEAQRMSLRLPAASPVNCGDSHTAELLGVVKGDGLTPAGVWEQCQGLAVTYVGGAGSALAPSAYALPRTAQLSVYVTASGRRASCVGFSTNARGRVRQIGGSVAGAGLTPRVCLNSKTWVGQRCSAAKNVAMTNVAWLSNSPTQAYPGDARALNRARLRCAALGRSAGLVAEAWFVPGATEWGLGNRYALCRLGTNEVDTGWQPAN